MLENSRAKLEKKHLDMICANNLKVDGAGFGTDTNVVTLIRKHSEQELPLQSKEMVSHAILDVIADALAVKMLGRQPMKRKWHTIFCLVSLLGVFLLSGCAGQENAAAPYAGYGYDADGTGQVRRLPQWAVCKRTMERNPTAAKKRQRPKATGKMSGASTRRTRMTAITAVLDMTAEKSPLTFTMSTTG